MESLLTALGPTFSAMGGLLAHLAGVLVGTGGMLSMNGETYMSGIWMVTDAAGQFQPFFNQTDASSYTMLAGMMSNASMATSAFTVVSKPMVESAGPMVGDLGKIVATLPDVMTAMNGFFLGLVDFLKN